MITLQVSLSAGDVRHAEYILPHQLRVWGGQVDEILLVVDTHRSRGRFDGATTNNAEQLDNLLRDVGGADARLRIIKVDYDRKVVASVGGMFFDRTSVPAKDFRGGPFYSYFFALWSARHDLILHVDSDMLFGGGSHSWLAEARALLLEDSSIAFASPLPGPPTRDNRLRSQSAEMYPAKDHAFQFPGISSRLFFTDRQRLLASTPKPQIQWASLRGMLKAAMEGNPAYELPEVVLSRWMNARELRRVDFLGDPPGMWSLHPPFRSERFYAELPSLIDRIENDRIPDEQRGNHDVADSLIDWTDARRHLSLNRWWSRLGKRMTGRR